MIYFEKSQPAPSCLATEKLKNHGDYKCGDVLERLKNDFKNKCYLCELKEPISINVEHFRPHKGNKELKFQWENLFWSCSHCNNVKLDKYEDIIDCTNADEEIESRIKLVMKPFPKEQVTVEALDEEQSTLSTKELLNGIYNGTTDLKTIESASLRNQILVEIMDFQEYLCDYYKDGFDDAYKEKTLAHIKRHLSQSSNFTTFKRWIIRDNEAMREEFERYFD